MGELYKSIINLCDKHGITGYKLCRDIGIQPSIVYDLKSGRKKTLNVDTVKKIAEYFGVSVDYLLGNQDKNTSSSLDEDEFYSNLSDFQKSVYDRLLKLNNDNLQLAIDQLDAMLKHQEKK